MMITIRCEDCNELREVKKIRKMCLLTRCDECKKKRKKLLFEMNMRELGWMPLQEKKEKQASDLQMLKQRYAEVSTRPHDGRNLKKDG